MSEIKTPIRSLNGHALVDEQARVEIEALKANSGSGGTTTETITRSGVVVRIDVDADAEIMVNGSSVEAVELVHHGKNFLPLTNIAFEGSGITITSNQDGSVHIEGTAEQTIYPAIVAKTDPCYLPAGMYTFSSNFPSAMDGTVTIKSQPSGGFAETVVNDLYSPRTINIESDVTYIAFFTLIGGKTYDCDVWAQLERGETATPYEQYENGGSQLTTLPATISAINGTNMMYTKTGDTLTVSATFETGSGNAGNSAGVPFDATVYELPVLTLDGDCTSMTKDDSVPLEFSFMGMTGTLDCKKQGSSSIQTGVEIGKDFDTDIGGLFNFTLKFPEAFEAKEGWGAQKKYVFKANAIDHSHARNICSCKLWGEVVKNRSGVPTELSRLVNGGAIDGFPIVIVLNRKFYAIGTFNIPKDGWMFGTPKAILCADEHTDATKFKALATLDGDFELEYVEDENNASWVLTSINTAIQAAIDGNIETLAQYIDIPSAIDYYIHTVEENADDGTDKNYILVTFDGVKWYFSAYDRDTTYGQYWNGKTFTSPSGGITFAQYASVHQVMNLIYTNKQAELKARAVALRDGIKSEINVCDVFTKFAAEIPAELLAANCRRWPLLRSTNASNTAQILNWYRLRRQIIDKEIDSWT